MSQSSFQVLAPGRVFLFGEHSDYLGLEVISMALDKTIKIDVKLRKDREFKINYLDLKETDSFTLDEEIDYRHKRDYLRSCFNVLKRNGILSKTGADLTVSGDIPIAAGLSSSSAFSIACVMAFSSLAKVKISTEETVRYAFNGEVVEFGESGGMMDHYSSAFGGIIHVDFGQEIKLTKVPTTLSGLIIGDSLQKKEDTVG
ncbi:MAG: GHMP family kinase ATP-binding protein, partial [Candidatus Heimdallarchaeota archaeon]